MIPMASPAVTVDRIAAVIDQQVITVSEISQLIAIRFFPRSGENEDEFRREVLESLIAQALRYRDVERFRPAEIPADAIEARLSEIRARFASPEAFDAAVAAAELTLDEVRAVVRRQLQVDVYIRERFAPTVFIPNEEIEEYYRGPWSAQRRERGLPIPPLASVREEIRTTLRSTRLEQEIEEWTARLRASANVDIYAWR
jgi:hypothetical protein